MVVEMRCEMLTITVRIRCFHQIIVNLIDELVAGRPVLGHGVFMPWLG